MVKIILIYKFLLFNLVSAASNQPNIEIKALRHGSTLEYQQITLTPTQVKLSGNYNFFCNSTKTPTLNRNLNYDRYWSSVQKYLNSLLPKLKKVGTEASLSVAEGADPHGLKIYINNFDITATPARVQLARSWFEASCE